MRYDTSGWSGTTQYFPPVLVKALCGSQKPFFSLSPRKKGKIRSKLSRDPENPSSKQCTSGFGLLLLSSSSTKTKWFSFRTA